MRYLVIILLMLWPEAISAKFGQEAVAQGRLGKLAREVESKPKTTPPPATRPTTGPQTQSTATLPKANSSVGPTERFTSGQTQTLDIAGLRIGMLPEQVAHELTSRGYSVSNTIRGASFEELLRIKREQIPYNKISRFKAAIMTQEFKRQYETIKIDFLSVPEGAVAYQLFYTNKDPGITLSKAQHLLRDRYGIDFYGSSLGKINHLRRSQGIDIPQSASPDSQRKFTWVNRNPRRTGPRAGVLVETDAQELNGNIEAGSLKLTLAGELLWESYQQEAIQSHIGPSSTTF